MATEASSSSSPSASSDAPPVAADTSTPPGITSSSSNDVNDNDKNVNGNTNNSSDGSNKLKRLFFNSSGTIRLLFLILPYVIGIIWTLLHPSLSILTGESKCRGWYIDEHSILMRFPFMSAKEPPPHLRNIIPKSSFSKSSSSSSSFATTNMNNNNLCDNLDSANNDNDSTNFSNNLNCYTHNSKFQIASIVPLANAIQPQEETIVFVVKHTSPSSSSLSSSTFHHALAKSLKNLASPIETPWLAKTFLVVTPFHSDSSSKVYSLEETVSNFLDAYYGGATTSTEMSSSSSSSTSTLLPPHLCRGIIRNIIAIDVEYNNDDNDDDTNTTTTTTTSTTVLNTNFRVIPHGKRGVLPNADLTFLIGKLFGSTQFLNGWANTIKNIALINNNNKRNKNLNNNNKKQFVMHSYPDLSLRFKQYIVDKYNKYYDNSSNNPSSSSKASLSLLTWLSELGDLFLFVLTAAIGPYPPHSRALDYGIDAITIEARFNVDSNNNNSSDGNTFERDPLIEFVQYMEYLLRSLSGLHEKLHHSFTLYWMPSPSKFVSHIEYLIPILLLLLPCAIRALEILFVTTTTLHLETIGISILITIIATISTALFVETSKGGSRLHEYINVGWWIFLYSIIVLFVNSWFRRKTTPTENGINVDNNNDEKDGEKDDGSVVRKDDDDDDSCSNYEQQKQRIVQTQQFVACTILIYCLVPIAFGHGALAYPICLMWTPLLAFPKYYYNCASGSPDLLLTGRHRLRLLCLVSVAIPILFITLPPVISFLIPGGIDYTAFVKFAYTPIHVQFLLLILCTTLQALYQ